MDKKEDKSNYNFKQEDATKYGEFISSYFGWITMDKQRENSKKLEDISKSDKEKN